MTLFEISGFIRDQKFCILEAGQCGRRRIFGEVEWQPSKNENIDEYREKVVG